MLPYKLQLPQIWIQYYYTVLREIKKKHSTIKVGNQSFATANLLFQSCGYLLIIGRCVWCVEEKVKQVCSKGVNKFGKHSFLVGS